MVNDELRNLVRTFEALGLIAGNAVKSGQLFKHQCELTEPDPDVLCEYGVRIPVENQDWRLQKPWYKPTK